jgi:hypothetical protein
VRIQNRDGVASAARFGVVVGTGVTGATAS